MMRMTTSPANTQPTAVGTTVSMGSAGFWPLFAKQTSAVKHKYNIDICQCSTNYFKQCRVSLCRNNALTKNAKKGHGQVRVGETPNSRLYIVMVKSLIKKFCSQH